MLLVPSCCKAGALHDMLLVRQSPRDVTDPTEHMVGWASSCRGPTSSLCVRYISWHVQADADEGAEQGATEALHHSLSPAQRSAIAESLPAESKAASSKCVEALGGLDPEASSFFCYPWKGALPDWSTRLSILKKTIDKMTP